MHKRIGLGLLVVCVVSFALPAAVADELAAVEKKLAAAWKKHKSMTAKFTMVTKMEQPGFAMESKSAGAQEVVRKGDKVLYRVEMTSSTVQKVADQETKTEQTMLTVSDGTHTHTLSETMGQKTVVKTKVDPQSTGDPEATFKFLRKDHTLKVLPEETIDGKKVFVIEATPKQVQPMAPAKLLYYFLQDDGLPVKMVASDQTGKPMVTMIYSDVEFDVKIDPQRFVFKVPEGVQVIDQTAEQP
jgi:outer membrane lipoprotein-sorting protein